MVWWVVTLLCVIWLTFLLFILLGCSIRVVFVLLVCVEVLRCEVFCSLRVLVSFLVLYLDGLLLGLRLHVGLGDFCRFMFWVLLVVGFVGAGVLVGTAELLFNLRLGDLYMGF